MTSDALQSTLYDLAHLQILPSRLSLNSDEEFGAGGYSDVYLATLDASTKVAVKELRITQSPEVRLRVAIRLARELKVWANLKHRNILKLLGYYLSENYGRAQLISPIMVNGNVILYIKNIQPEISTRLKFVRDISLGMDYLHNCDPPICHGDLKPANVLISGELDAVLCDFGLASFIQESGVPSGLTTSRTTKGSMRYMSPELLLDEEAMHSLKSDVWAWGCTAFEILTDCIPYSACKKESAITFAIFQKIAPGAIDNFINLGSDPNHNLNSDHHLALELLQAKVPECWDFEPNERPSSSSILWVFANWEESDSSTAFPTYFVGEVSGSGYNDDDECDEPSSAKMCKVCRVLPVFLNFEFCSKTCEESAAQVHARRGSEAWQGYGQGSVWKTPLPLDDDDDEDAHYEDKDAYYEDKDAYYDDEDCYYDDRSAAQGHARRGSEAWQGYGQEKTPLPLVDDDDDDGYDDDEDDGGDDGDDSGDAGRANSLCMNCQFHKVKGQDFCSDACLTDFASRLPANTQNGTSNYQSTGVAIPHFANGGQAPPFPSGNPGDFAPIPYQNTVYGDQAYSQGWPQQQLWQQEGYGRQQPAPAPAPQEPLPPPGELFKIPNRTGTEYKRGGLATRLLGKTLEYLRKVEAAYPEESPSGDTR